MGNRTCETTGITHLGDKWNTTKQQPDRETTSSNHMWETQGDHIWATASGRHLGDDQTDWETNEPLCGETDELQTAEGPRAGQLFKRELRTPTVNCMGII